MPRQSSRDQYKATRPAQSTDDRLFVQSPGCDHHNAQMNGKSDFRLGRFIRKTVSEKRTPPIMGTEQPDIVLRNKQETQLRRPPMYKVVLYNDDYTPMEFVVLILRQYFHMTLPKATGLMLNVHHNGAGICGVFTYEVAETKRDDVIALAKREQYPLRCCVERA